ncbi:PG0870-related protein, partial [uncultured Alistipes sp.]
MSEYRFHLQKYSYGSKIACPNCGGSRCFVRYVDEEGVVVFPDRVGKCDHEHKCCYHYTPREYFRDNPDMMNKADYSRFERQRSLERKFDQPVPSFISPDIVGRSLSHYDINPLYHYLS